MNPALAFRMMYPASCISFLCDTGRGHFDVSDATAEYIALFLKKAMKVRLPEMAGADGSSVTLKCADETVYKELYERLLTQQEIFQYLPGDSVSYAASQEQLTLTFFRTSEL